LFISNASVELIKSIVKQLKKYLTICDYSNRLEKYKCSDREVVSLQKPFRELAEGVKPIRISILNSSREQHAENIFE